MKILMKSLTLNLTHVTPKQGFFILRDGGTFSVSVEGADPIVHLGFQSRTHLHNATDKPRIRFDTGNEYQHVFLEDVAGLDIFLPKVLALTAPDTAEKFTASFSDVL